MNKFNFKIEYSNKKSLARAGVIETPHGHIKTPAFVPVGTAATVKALSPRDLDEIGASVIFANTYHLYLRPGEKTVKKMGGLHKFMNWHGSIMTDSGGFQVFSLGLGLEHGVGKIANIFPSEEFSGRKNRDKAKKESPQKITPEPKLVKITDEGAFFTSHLDGSEHFLNPKKSIQIQEDLGADIILTFDECTSPLSDKKYTRRAMERTHRWAKESLDAKTRDDQALYGIVQGGAFKDLREKSAKIISSLPFDGFAIGGSLGKSRLDMFKVVEWTIKNFKEKNKPRHLLGIGDPAGILENVQRGCDTFDCVGPTRIARNGELMTERENVNIFNAKYKENKNPIEKICSCYTCKNFSLAYMHHLFKSREILGAQLATIHNLSFMMRFMKNIREAIKGGRFAKFKKGFLEKYK
ncbi:MAG: Queuine tRNA-ribosyltransferase [candidate division CPR1 bacterium GW2011_GWA2_42_17]|uniref:Queuine tRNA-ribosyltransferase n=1 Tax=candidate division CPR1 bacterium GW2011_GWA2_42_17 TaxID=1618341 RepID=A0A0G0Z0R7_9BACT|nr:MAG: Queuine tRNA-ribosyltransferase [candidate division CPR1 bacterium GW2011_GWA2_42_17]